MFKLSWLEIALVVLGLFAIAGGNRLEIPALRYGGLTLAGLGFLLGGSEAIVTRRMTFQPRGNRSATYRGWGAVFYGIVFVWIGMALIAVAGILSFGVEEAVIWSVIQHPGFALLNAGLLALAAGGIALTGSRETQPDRDTGLFLKVASALLRAIPAGVLFLLGLALLGLGALEIASPATFDQMGGGFLETLFQKPS